jgi:hypothetical protein
MIKPTDEGAAQGGPPHPADSERQQDPEEARPLLPSKALLGPPGRLPSGLPKSPAESQHLRSHRREESEMASFGLMLHEETEPGDVMHQSKAKEVAAGGDGGGGRRPMSLRRRFLHFVHMEDHEDLRHVMMHYFHLDALSLRSADATRKHCLPVTLFHLDTMPSAQKRILVHFHFARFNALHRPPWRGSHY